MTHEEFILKFYETVWSGGDIAAIDDFFAPTATLDGFAHDMSLRPEDLVVFTQGLLRLIEQPRFGILHILSRDDQVAALVRCSARCARTGNEASITAQIMLRFVDGKIVEAYNHYDMMALFIALGLMPADTLERMLSVHPLR